MAEPNTPELVKEQARALYVAGSKHYDLREYEQAVESFREAYNLHPQPLLLFNIGQAYRQLRECVKARDFYGAYLGKLPAADNREQVDRFIREMDDCERAANERTARERARAVEREPVEVTVRERAEGSPTKMLTIVGVVTGAAGALVVGGGVYFSLEARDKARALEDRCVLGCDVSEIADLDRRGIAAERTAIVLYTLGGVALATGAGLLIYAALRSDHVTIVPTPAGATITKSWSF
ncbi:MAG: hypothetical protein M4D80_33525 [Myxococcota bacterium]|nr:hypothetical protein [Deltaproteobacteria bacterium]MDQ3340106.1 hypothetical protein [Myxococcota bacterium]